jgi:predicted MFS family arabinose efflux permease
MIDTQDRKLAARVDAGQAAGLAERAPAWLAVASLAVSTFASVTTEFLPVGLLTNIAASLHVSEGAAGLMVTMPALVAAPTGPLLIVAAGGLDRRTLLLALSALLVASNLLAAMAQDLPTMLLARALLGLVVGGFWTFAPGATGHMVPAALQPRAMSYVLAGISVATVAGVPAGALVGGLAGWRAAFIAAAVLSAIVLAFQLRVLPSMPAARAILPRELLAPLSNRGPRMVLAVSLFMMGGHFVAYTYLGPVLRQMFGMSPDGIAMLLLVYGVAGFAGTFAGGQLVMCSARGTALAAAIVIAAVLPVCAFAGPGAIAATLAVLIWGGAFGLVPVALTSWMQKASPDAPDAGQALLVTFFQTALASGAFVGGLVVDSLGITGSLLLGGALSMLAAALVVFGKQCGQEQSASA